MHDWPDNRRGVQRLVHRLASSELEAPITRVHLEQLLPELVRAPAGDATVEAAPETRRSASPPAAPRPARPTRDELLAVYAATGGNVRAMSRHFGKDRRQIYRWLKELDIERHADQRSTR